MWAQQPGRPTICVKSQLTIVPFLPVLFPLLNEPLNIVKLHHLAIELRYQLFELQFVVG